MILSDTIAHERTLVRKYDKTKLLQTALLLLGLFLGSFPAGRDPHGTMYAHSWRSHGLSTPARFITPSGRFS